ncbi:MAG: ATP-binding protein [Acidobacteria bacterium]|nr:ATP-binding protein [Acidobacteriota bacterium]
MNRRPTPRVTATGGRRFHRGLMWFSVIFGLLLLADVGVVGNLIFRDLSRQVIEEAKARSLAEAKAFARQFYMESAATMASPAAVYRLVRDTYAVARYADRLLERYTFIERIRVFNEQGQLVMPARYRQANLKRKADGERSLEATSGGDADTLTRSPQSATGADTELPGEIVMPEVKGPPPRDNPALLALYRIHGIPLPDLTLGPGDPASVDRVSRRQSVITVTAPTPGGATVEVSLSEEMLTQEIDQLRRDLIIKILIGAAVSLVLIVVAYIFVVKLFNKTRRLESEAQMADRLAYVGTLAAGLAHEIRNPLSAMKLNLQMLDGAIEHPDQESRDLLVETQGEVERLGGLVTSFLSYARPARLKMQPSDLNEIVRETALFLTADARRRHVSIETELGVGLPVIPLDPAQVRQAILNIVHNAVAAVEANGGGKVALRTSVNGRSEVQLEIEDEGAGVPAEKLDTIFQVFYSSKPGGTGLGLPIALRVLEGHGGQIKVDSRPGTGTRFTLVFSRHANRGSRAAL